MICSVRTLGISGLRGSAVTAECFISNGLPGFDIVGLPDTAVKEARERVRAAIKTAGMSFPPSRITVNLAPANLKKAGTHYDLPILLGILIASGQVRRPRGKWAFLGEVSLDGGVRPVSGVLPMVLSAKDNGIEAVFVPKENAAEATLAHGPAIYPVCTVRELADMLNGERELVEEPIWVPTPEERTLPDFKDVLGQEQVKRALEIAAAGGHNVLLIGPPGSGKSMLSKRLPSILPDMTWEESLEVSQIYSVLGLLDAKTPLVRSRPFRSPHHTISAAGLTGGGSTPRPGEISMAHKGVLFLDEVPEFGKNTLDLMRQPLEDGCVTISRMSGTVTYPAEFMLVCAMNPCKCGYFGSPDHTCTCTPFARSQYLAKISGPMLDRIDIQIEVGSLTYETLRDNTPREPSAEIRKRVEQARERMTKRYAGTGIHANGQLTPAMIREYCVTDEKADAVLAAAFDRLGLSARGYDRILRLAKTIADMDACDIIGERHVAQAIQLRSLDRKYWQTV